MPESKSPVLEPHTQAFIDSLTAQGGEPLYKLSYPAARQILEDLQAAPVAKLPAEVEERVLLVGPTGEVPATPAARTAIRLAANKLSEALSSAAERRIAA